MDKHLNGKEMIKERSWINEKDLFWAQKQVTSNQRSGNSMEL